MPVFIKIGKGPILTESRFGGLQVDFYIIVLRRNQPLPFHIDHTPSTLQLGACHLGCSEVPERIKGDEFADLTICCIPFEIVPISGENRGIIGHQAIVIFDRHNFRTSPVDCARSCIRLHEAKVLLEKGHFREHVAGNDALGGICQSGVILDFVGHPMVGIYPKKGMDGLVQDFTCAVHQP